MDTVNTTIPGNAVIAAAFVLIYSFFCLSCGCLLVVVLYLSKERYSYVILFAVSTTCSTIFNMIQQINYLANWHQLRIEQYQASVAAYNQPALALGPLSRGFNEALFWIVLYFYNVDSMLMLFWAIALVASIWNWKTTKLRAHEKWLGITSKIAAFILPALVVGLRKSYQLRIDFVTAVILLNILMLLSFAVGTICLITILVKYLRGRLGLGSYACDSAPSGGISRGTAIKSTWSGLKMRVDPWLVLRFTIAFAILSALEVFLVIFEVRRYNKIQKTAEIDAPDFSASATITDILNYIPGVTASLFAFLLFGTTGPQRALYRSLLRSCSPCKQSRPESSRIEKGTSQNWSRMTEDIEMSRGSHITKGTSVDISVVDRNANSCNEFDIQPSMDYEKWYPGRKIGILDDP